MPQTPNALLTQQHPQIKYDPNYLFDTVIKQLGLKNDAALARCLEVAPPVISKMRHRQLAVGASLLLSLHEVTGISFKDLRALMGDNRASFRLDSEMHMQPARTNAYVPATSSAASSVATR